VQREVAEVLGAVKKKRAEVEGMTAMVTALADLRAHNREGAKKKGGRSGGRGREGVTGMAEGGGGGARG